MNDNKKRQNKKPFYNKRKNFDNRKASKGDRIVYTLKPSGPAPLDDWQLKLQAMLDCFDFKDKENYKKLLNARYEELKHKQRTR